MCHNSMHHPVWGSRPVERKPQKRQINAKALWSKAKVIFNGIKRHSRALVIIPQSHATVPSTVIKHNHTHPTLSGIESWGRDKKYLSSKYWDFFLKKYNKCNIDEKIHFIFSLTISNFTLLVPTSASHQIQNIPLNGIAINKLFAVGFQTTSNHEAISYFRGHIVWLQAPWW